MHRSLVSLVLFPGQSVQSDAVVKAALLILLPGKSDNIPSIDVVLSLAVKTALLQEAVNRWINKLYIFSKNMKGCFITITDDEENLVG